jgi:uncharacterized lipoprotein YddW (UPF0748 family)
MEKIFLLFLFCLLSIFTYAQSPKREFRGAWIATVGNVDYPSSKSLTTAQQQAEFIKILDQHQQAGINAVMVQIRSYGDAFYPSDIVPWSEYLTGRQGKAPEPFYDPVAFMISECRKRNIEFHAWFNPYRVVLNVNTVTLDTKHVAIKHPDWLLAYGNLRVLDPGNQEVRKHVTQVVMEVARKYDVDGIHFDDYFYPYPTTGLTIIDSTSFKKDPRGFTKKEDWRRDNVDLMVKTISDSLKAAKPWVKFGISPFGIWQNKTSSSLGSDTKGLESYSEIYCNTRKWLENRWVDYIMPQLYWNIGNIPADFSILVPWWANNSFDSHLYIGHGAYRINESAAWQNPSEMPRQVRLVRNTANTQGSCFYNTNTLNKNLLGFRDSLITNLYKKPALMPTMAWKDVIAPPAPQNLTVVASNTGLTLKWNKPSVGITEIEKIRGYVVYRFANDEKIDLTKSDGIRTIIPKDTNAYFDSETSPQAFRYTYVVTALDRLHNESSASNNASIVVVTSTETNENPLTALYQNAPNPFSEYTKINYHLAKTSNVKLRILDLFGKEHSVLVNEKQQMGDYSIDFQSFSIASGAYIYVLETDEEVLSRRMLVLR